MNNPLSALRRIWTHDKTVDAIKITAALVGVVAASVWLGDEHWMISLILGVIASALAETEDRVIGRVQALAMTLVCFAVVTFSVQALFPYPWVFVVGLTVSTFGFVMLGAAGERYGTIAVASLVLAVYTMLSVDHQTAIGATRDAGPLATILPFWRQSILLLAGAAWYGLISILAAALFSTRAARQSLSRVFNALSQYLALKAELLEPVGGRDENAQRLALAEQNARLVRQLNRAREVLIRWVQGNRPTASGARHLKWYFLAQDVHERASSAHYPYKTLSSAFARSDILFRASRLMRLQAQACTRLADKIMAGTRFDYGQTGVVALDELAAALAHIQAHPEQSNAPLSETLADLCRNITTIERLLANAGNPDALEANADTSLRDSNPRTLREMWRRIRLDLTPASGRFRHGLRLSLALATGYGLLHLFDLTQGYWVLLTTVFVCQPTYSGTWRRLGERVGGTVVGLVAAGLFITLFPNPTAQLALAVVAGVAFFILRSDRYPAATACITILVLVCFNQIGSGYALIWPRLADTVLGAIIAGAAVAIILPDWQSRRLHLVMARAIETSGIYLGVILDQYRSAKHDDLPYRIARRDAHNADADLSGALSAMLGEPGRHRLSPEFAFRFLCASHTLLGYISALGAHRERVETWHYAPLIDTAVSDVQRRLDAITRSLTRRERIGDAAAIAPDLGAQLESVPADAVPAERRVVRQLSLISQLTPELATLADAFAGNEAEAQKAL
ncbi:YccS family putative transporter [Uliginosibacterium sp. sgz301328]|uniref:YccS family putative transporter n=1 Tax=Uliginosibacterium sp. sgz301328 TaxID=3243764 RepID=UPI00359E0DD2